MKKIIYFLILINISSCLSSLDKENIKSINSISASQRINSVDQNSQVIFNEDF